MTYQVLFTKHFVTGNLAGIDVHDQRVPYPTLKTAQRYVTTLRRALVFQDLVTGARWEPHNVRINRGE